MKSDNNLSNEITFWIVLTAPLLMLFVGLLICFLPTCLYIFWGFFMLAIFLLLKPFKIMALVLCFIAFLGSVSDGGGNPVSDYVLKIAFYSLDGEIVTTQHVSHRRRGRTSISYEKAFVAKDRSQTKVGFFPYAASNAVAYFGTALLLCLLKYPLYKKKYIR